MFFTAYSYLPDVVVLHQEYTADLYHNVFGLHIVIKMYSVWKQFRGGQPDLQLIVTQDVRVSQA